MRCRACDRCLTDFESTRRSASGHDFLDLCTRCLGPIVDSVETVENFELYDPDRDDLSSILSLPEPQPGERGSGPDPDESEEG